MSKKTKYEYNIQNRSLLGYFLGLGARFKKHLYYSYSRFVARKNGASIGENVVLSLALARKSNENLTIGCNTSIQTDLLDLRSKISIGKNVIIGSGVEILTCSHNIDSPEWEFKSYGIVIEDYVWIATKAFVLPSCRNIGYGAVCAAGSVIVKDIQKMQVVAGNPSIFLKNRKQVHKNLVVESLLSGDYVKYRKTWKKRKEKRI